jgi:hypothetical protein
MSSRYGPQNVPATHQEQRPPTFTGRAFASGFAIATALAR